MTGYAGDIEHPTTSSADNVDPGTVVDTDDPADDTNADDTPDPQQ